MQGVTTAMVPISTHPIVPELHALSHPAKILVDAIDSRQNITQANAQGATEDLHVGDA